MKIICDCGNETHLNTIDDETGKENRIDECEGQYATLYPDTFALRETHDIVYITCNCCEKAVWLFT